MIRFLLLGLGAALGSAVCSVRGQEVPVPGTAEFMRASTEALVQIANARSDAAAAAALAAFADRNLETLRAQGAGNPAAATALVEAHQVLEEGLSQLALRAPAGEEGSLRDVVAAASLRHAGVLKSLLDSGALPPKARRAVERALAARMQGHPGPTGAAEDRGAGAGPPAPLHPDLPPDASEAHPLR